jgi:hypothetical protein
MQLEAVNERLWRCTWRPRLSEFGCALGGRDLASLVIHLEAMIDRDWWSTSRRSIWRRSVREGGATGAETLFIG